MQTYIVRELIQQLESEVKTTLTRTATLQSSPQQVLLLQPHPGSWSIAQTLEHLNAYNRYYLPEIEKALLKSATSAKNFKPGWLGDYFTKLMLPGENGTLAKKMSAPKGYAFAPELDANKVVAEYISGQEKLLELLRRAMSKDLAGVRVPISLSKMIKLKLGDTFRFLIAHQKRHFLQIERAYTVVSLKQRV